MSHFSNSGSEKKQVAFAPLYPSNIIPIDMSQKNAFLCAALGTEVAITFQRKLDTGFFAGEGLFLATLKNTGRVYLKSLPFPRLANRIS